MTIIIYHLHADGIDTRAAHYTGSTRIDQFERRLRDHVRGHGSRFTTALFNRGAHWQLASIEFALNRQEETKAKRRYRWQQHCPICTVRGRITVPFSRQITMFDGVSF